jgi:hypothetical protein
VIWPEIWPWVLAAVLFRKRNRAWIYDLLKHVEAHEYGCLCGRCLQDRGIDYLQVKPSPWVNIETWLRQGHKEP